MLDLVRQRGRDAVRVDRVIIQTFRLQEDLVLGPVSKAHDLVLDGRTIARPAPGDCAAIDSRVLQIVRNDLVCRLRRVGDGASDLRHRDTVCQEREGNRLCVGLLLFQRIPIDGRFAQARRRSGLEAPHPQLEPVERFTQTDSRLLADASCRNALGTAMDDTAQEGPGCQHNA